MISSEKEKLFSYEYEHLSIGITETGVPLQAVPIPWHGYCGASNMCIPDVYLCEEDLYDREITAQINRFTVIGFYAFCRLKSYEILAFFSELRDIFLKDAKNLHDISFIKEMPSLLMLFLQDATLTNLDSIIFLHESPNIEHCRYLGLYNCHVEDISSLLNSGHCFRELLIWNHWSPTERNRWQQVKSQVYRYYRLDSAPRKN